MPTSESTAPVQSQIPHSSAPYAYDTEVSYMDPQDYMLNQSCDEFNDHEESWMDESPKEDHSLVGGFIRKMEGKGHMLFNKFVAKVEMDVEALHEFRGCSVAEMVENINVNLDLEEESDDDVTIMERGLDDEFLASDGVRLERFRVKTVNIAGVAC